MDILKKIAKLVQTFEPIEGVSFISTDYTNKDGFTKRYLVNVGVTYENAQRKDLEIAKTAVYVETDRYTKETFEEAQMELIKSLNISLGVDAKNISKEDKQKHANRSNGQKNAYTHIGTTGLKIHNETGGLYVFGMKVSEKIIATGETKADTRRPKTVAKDTIKKGMKSHKYRQFAIDSADVFKVSGETIEFGNA